MKKKKDTITINKKMMFGIAPAIAIIGILIVKHQPDPLVLFLIGIIVSIIIGINYKEWKK